MPRVTTPRATTPRATKPRTASLRSIYAGQTALFLMAGILIALAS
jgi:hypothetical protein